MFPAAFCSDLLMRSHTFSIIFKSGGYLDELSLLWITFRTCIPLFHAGFWQLYGRRVTSQNIKVSFSFLPSVF
jgi:hypothetical protein